MKMLVDFKVLQFDDAKAEAAMAACQALCEGCDDDPGKCFVNSVDCPIKDAVEALGGMIRIGTGVRRYESLARL